MSQPLPRLVPALAAAIVCGAGAWTSTAWAQGAVCNASVQLSTSLNPNGPALLDGRGRTINFEPAWHPESDLIVYSAFVSFNIAFGQTAVYGVNADGTGDGVRIPTLLSGFGISNALGWLPDGRLLTEERIGIHEYRVYNAALTGFGLALFIPGGQGGGWLVVSRDGSTALWRASTAGGGGLQTIRTAPFASLAGQPASGFGTVLAPFTRNSVTQFWTEPAALNYDGSEFALAQPRGAGWDIAIHQTATGALVRWLTNTGLTEGMFNRFPEYSPDGSAIAFSRIPAAAVPDRNWDLFTINPDGTGLMQLTDTTPFSELEPTWAPDGQRLAFRGAHPTPVGQPAPPQQIYLCDALANQPPEITAILDPLVLEGDTTGGFDAAGLTAAAAGVTTIDPDAGPQPVSLTNDAPAVLPLGDTLVEWTASDGEDSDTATHTVTVRDTTGPSVTVPADISQVATSPLGDVVNYAASASDIVDAAPALVCDPASGSTLPLGDTSVDCTATDASGNETTASFMVRLAVGQATFDGFVAKIDAMGLHQGTANSLRAKVNAAAGHFADGDLAEAVGSLNALINEANAQEGKKLTEGQADELRACANALIGALAGA